MKRALEAAPDEAPRPRLRELEPQIMLSATPALLLSTEGNVNDSGNPDLTGWTDGTVLELADPGLELESASTDTAGTFSSLTEFDAFGNDVDIDGLHYVSRNLTVGGANAVDLQLGDILFSTKDDESLSSLNSLDVDKEDVTVFRPFSTSDYSQGTFIPLFDDFNSLIGVSDLRSLSLVETGTAFGDVTLNAGDLLFSTGGGTSNDLFVFRTLDVGAGTTDGSADLLIDGNEIDVNRGIVGLELIEETVTIGTVTLNSGELLVAVNADDDVGSNQLDVTEHDIFSLTVTQTTPLSGAGSAAATATLVFEGSDVDLDSKEEDLNAVALAIESVNSPPVNTVPGLQTTAVDTPIVFESANANLLAISDDDAGTDDVEVTLSTANGLLTLSTTTGLSFSSGDGTADPTMTFRGTVDEINAALDGMTYTPPAGWNGSTNLTLSTNDLGNNGTGGALTDTDSVPVQVGATTFAQGANGYTGVVDTELNEDDADSPLSGESDIVVDLNDSGGEAQGLIKFTNIFGTGPNQIPEGSLINSASLSVYVINISNSTASIELSQILTSWDVSSTWNSMVNGVQTDGIEVATTPDSVLAAPDSLGRQEFTGLRDTVQAWSDGASNEGWAILTDSTNGWDIASSDVALANLRPYLIVDYTAPSPPVLDLDANDSNADGTGFSTSFVEGDPAVSITDTDATITDFRDSRIDSMVVTITNLQDGSDEILAADTSGTSITASYSSGVLTLSGTDDILNYQQVLRTITYENVDQNPSTTDRTIEFVANDTYGSSNIATAVVAVTGVNDSPVNTVPGPQSTLEDTPLTFSSTNGNAIQIADVDAPNSPIRLRLAVDHGTLSLSTTTDLIFMTGDGTDDPVIELLGTVDDINSALAGLTYTPGQNVTSSATLALTTDDRGFTGSGGPQQDTDTVTIAITPVNDDPTTTGIADVAVAEDAPDTDIDLFAAFEDVEDADNQLTYSVVSNTNAALFSSVTIDPVTGTLTLDYAPDANGMADLTVRATDTGGLTVDSTFNVDVSPVNDNPTTTGIADVAVAEDAPDTDIDLFAAFEDIEDADNQLTYSVVSNTNAALFSSVTIDPVTGTLTLDYAPNANGAADLTVRATDTGGLTVDTTFNVDVSPVNDNPTTTGIADVAVAEDAPDTDIDLFAAFEDVEDADNQLTYSVVSNTNAALFTSVTIDPVTGTLTLDYAPDANGMADLTVRATDTGGLTVDSTFNVDISPVNDNPTTTGIADVAVAEDAPDTDIDLFAAFEDVEDADNQLTYSVVSNTNAALFTSVTIDPVTGTLTLDYAPDANGMADLTVRATDTGGLTVDSTFNVDISPVNDNPTTTGIADVAVDEDAPDTDIDLFAAFEDVEDADNQLTYSVVSNTNAALFTSVTIDPVTGTLTLDYAPDANGTADLTVRATDTGGLTVDTTFNVDISPVNDNPTTTGIADVAVAEDAPDTDIDLFAAFEDVEDADNQLTYSVVSNTNAALFSSVTIDPVTGTLTLDYAPDANGTADLTVRATDTGGLTVDTTFNVDISPVNDNPTTTGIADVTVAEDASDTDIDLFTAFEDVEDADNQLTYSVVSNTNAALFSNVTIDPVTGTLTLDYAPDANGTADLTVRATDTGGLTVDATFNVDISPVNDNPTTTGIADVTVAEDAPDTDIDLFAAFEDVEDADNQLTYSVVSNTNAALFSSVTIDPVTGTLTLDYAPDANGMADLTVRATDTGGLTVDSTFNVDISPVNDNPTTTGIADVSVDEDAPDTNIDLFAAFEDVEDADNQLSYSVVSNTNAALFTSVTIDPVTGTLTLDYAPNANGTADLTVRATDTGGLTVDTTFNVDVAAVNDVPTTPGQSYSMGQAESLVVASDSGVLAGAADVEGDSMTAVLVSSSSNGSLSLQPDGSFVYTPDPGFFGTDVFTYQVSDGTGSSNTATVTIDVDELPAPPGGSGGDPPPPPAPDDSDTESETETVEVTPIAPPEAEVVDSNKGHRDFTAPFVFDSSPPADLGKLRISILQQNVDTVNIASYAGFVAQDEVALVGAGIDGMNAQVEAATAAMRASLLNLPNLFDELDDLQQEVTGALGLKGLVVGATATALAGFSAGYVYWALRGGSLLASMVSTVPAWRLMDPLPVLSSVPPMFHQNASKTPDVDLHELLQQQGDLTDQAAGARETTAEEVAV